MAVWVVEGKENLEARSLYLLHSGLWESYSQSMFVPFDTSSDGGGGRESRIQLH